MSFAYLDGHAATLPLEDLYRVHWHRDFVQGKHDSAIDQQRDRVCADRQSRVGEGTVDLGQDVDRFLSIAGEPHRRAF